MLIETNDVCQMTNEIWSGMLQIELSSVRYVSVCRGGIGACVQITEPGNGRYGWTARNPWLSWRPRVFSA